MLIGGGGRDVLIGGAGPDSLHGDGGRDSFNMRDGVELAAKGRDRVYARDGHPDAINCGARRDLAVVDEVEDGIFDCEVDCEVGSAARGNPRRRGRGAGRARRGEHDLVKLESSGLLERLGYGIPKVTYDSLFRYPDRVREAFEA